MKEKIIQSSLRLPRSTWLRIRCIAEAKRLSLAQAVETAVLEYCEREETATKRKR